MIIKRASLTKKKMTMNARLTPYRRIFKTLSIATLTFTTERLRSSKEESHKVIVVRNLSGSHLRILSKAQTHALLTPSAASLAVRENNK